MKTIIKLAMIALLLPTLAYAEQYKEGKHYETISEKATKSPEIKEFFSFYCPACNNFENTLYEVKPKLNKNIKFKKSHVDFMGGYSKENQKMLSKALATAEVLPQKDKIISAMFGHIHGKRGKFNSEADVKDIFIAQGVDADKFDKLFKGFSIRTKTSKMNKDQIYYNQIGALKSVPTFIINGKYKMIIGKESGISSADDMSKLINYLAAK